MTMDHRIRDQSVEYLPCKRAIAYGDDTEYKTVSQSKFFSTPKEDTWSMFGLLTTFAQLYPFLWLTRKQLYVQGSMTCFLAFKSYMKHKGVQGTKCP